MDVHECQLVPKTTLQRYLLSSFSFDIKLHILPPLFILVNCFQCNLTQPWHCLFRRWAWPMGLLCNWRYWVQLETRKSLRSRWSIKSRQSRCWKGTRFIPRPRLKQTYPHAAWYPCQLWSQPSRSMCSRWNMCSKWVVKFSMFFPQTSRGKRHLLQIISMSGTIIRRLWMHHLRRGFVRWLSVPLLPVLQGDYAWKHKCY